MKRESVWGNRPLALITGVSRKISIGAGIAIDLAENGWDIVITYWRDYDKSMPWGSEDRDLDYIRKEIEEKGANFYTLEADLNNTQTPEEIFNQVEKECCTPTALILSHCYSVDSDILTTDVESFDLHFSINTRASWLLIKEFGKRFSFDNIPGRIIALTSDHVTFNLPYGASKGALDRIVIASSEEFRDKRVLANVINPGANDTGWMDEDFKNVVAEKSYQGRVGTPQDTANLVTFLCSRQGEWINGQLLKSNGGITW